MKTVRMIKSKLLYFFLLLLSSNCPAADGMPQFNAKSFNSQLFWMIITFTALYFIISYFILPRIRENIRLRKNKIANDLERAENIKAEVEKIAQLARLYISDSEIDEVTGRIRDILALIDQMQSVDTDDVVPLAHPLDLTQRLREDDVTEFNRRGELQLLAPKVEQGLYLVPKVIE